MISEVFISEMTEHNTSAKGMNWDWGTGDICTGDRSPEAHTPADYWVKQVGMLQYTQTHLSLERSASVTCTANENNSKYWSWHSSPNHLLNHDRGGLFMWVIWLLLKFHQYWDKPQNSITPTEMTTGLPAGQIRYPAPHIIQPFMSRRCLKTNMLPKERERETQKKDRDSLGNICLCKNSIKHTDTLWESITQKPQGF